MSVNITTPTPSPTNIEKYHSASFPNEVNNFVSLPCDTGCPPIFCDQSFGYNGEIGTRTLSMYLGVGTGVCGIEYHANPGPPGPVGSPTENWGNASLAVPDRFTIIWNDQRYSSGFRGDSYWNNRLALLGYPAVEGIGSGIILFTKTSASPNNAFVQIDSPILNSRWSVKAICPPGPTPTPSKTQKATPTPTKTPSNTPTHSITPSVTNSSTPTQTPTHSCTPTPTPTKPADCDFTVAYNGSIGTYDLPVKFGQNIGIAGIFFDANPGPPGPIGSPTENWGNPLLAIPDNFTILWNGEEYSSGFRGNDYYDRKLIELGYTPTSGIGTGLLSFNKFSNLPETGIVRVISPITNSRWSFNLKCPSELCKIVICNAQSDGIQGDSNCFTINTKKNSNCCCDVEYKVLPSGSWTKLSTNNIGCGGDYLPKFDPTQICIDYIP